jgi:hypothetical protein
MVGGAPPCRRERGGLSATNAWAEPLSVMKVNLAAPLKFRDSRKIKRTSRLWQRDQVGKAPVPRIKEVANTGALKVRR